MAVDATTVLASAITGAAGLGGAYFAMRQQVKTLQEQLRSERETAREKRRETKTDARLQSYRDLLDAERRLRTLLASKETFSEAEYAKWTSEFRQLHDLVVLTATEDVRALTETLFALFRRIDNERISSAGMPFVDALIAAFGRYEHSVEETCREMVAAMRADVADVPVLPASAPLPIPEPVPADEVHQVALVAADDVVPGPELERAARAFETQVTRDFAPVWNVAAEISTFSDTDAVPDSHWVIELRADLDQPGTLAYHTDIDGRPVGFVQTGADWTMSLSHTLLEMLACPRSDRFIRGTSPKAEQGQVEFLIQTCDPCMASAYGYEVDGIPVSDFCTPSFYTAPASTPGRYDHRGAIEAPRVVAPGCYMSWYEPDSRHYWQVQHFGDEPEFKDLGEYENRQRVVDSLRRPVQIGFFGSG